MCFIHSSILLSHEVSNEKAFLFDNYNRDLCNDKNGEFYVVLLFPDSDWLQISCLEPRNYFLGLLNVLKIPFDGAL